jgi:RNA polymerase sigma-70 factor, ECF subfamily
MVYMPAASIQQHTETPVLKPRPLMGQFCLLNLLQQPFTIRYNTLQSMPDENAPGQITLFLRRLSAGDSSAETPLAEAVYSEIRATAKRLFDSGKNDATLQATSLVNIVLLELVRLRTIEWRDREHFFRTAARLLRRRFIDHIRTRKAAKRPQSMMKSQLEDFMLPTEERFDEILDIDQALLELGEFDPDLAELVELVYFGGCPLKTVAEMRGVTTKTVGRHLTLAEKWLRTRLSCPLELQKSAIKSGI